MTVLQAEHLIRQGRAPRAQTWCLSLRRDALPNGTEVVPVANDHVVAAYNETHREILRLEDESTRTGLVGKLVERPYGADRELRDYTLDQLKPLLAKLLRAGLVQERYTQTAKAILEWGEPPTDTDGPGTATVGSA